MFKFIEEPMIWLIGLIYDMVQNYGVAIILFTLLIKALLFPLGLKQQRSMVKQQKLAPQLAELQKKYANDKEKLSKETMELYKANGANPLSGCLPMLLQIPIIIALFAVVRRPIEMGWAYNFNFLGMNLANYPWAGWNSLNQFVSGKAPDGGWATISLLLIPILSGVTSWLQSALTPQPQQPQVASNDDAPSTAAQTGKMMKFMMPVISVMFTFNAYCGVGIYWIVSNVFQIAQQYFTRKYFEKKEANVDVIDTVKKNRKNSQKHR